MIRFYIHILLVALFCLGSLSLAQNPGDEQKRQGLLLMKEGRYGEAVDQFNKYIAANPRSPDGYHLRGLCFEKRIQYEYAVIDLRRSLRLFANDPVVQKDLNRIIAIWHKQLYQKIDGHKRDIAIDPNHAFSYLEIGKSYRWLEEWSLAEEWYDKYLARDDNASPDEIIRYCVILAKTGSYVKGERITKKYTIRYPEDWRIWSRYGYFTLWLGKFKISENAFLTSLSFKPFFGEALDGLDLARRQGYLTINIGRDHTKTEEYAIDRYYRILEKEPEDDPTRFSLIQELIKVNRYEEAYQQLQYLQPKHSEDAQYKSLFKTVDDYRDSTYNKNVEKYTAILKENPSDKEAVIKLSEAYSNLFYYDNAIEVLKEYLQDIPEDQALDARFKYAQYTAWNYEWEVAIAQLNKLLELDPDNPDYMLLRGQIGIWTVTDLELAEKYLLRVHEKRPKDLDALISLNSLFAWNKNYDLAAEYLELAKIIAPNNPDVINAESNFAIRKAGYDDYVITLIRGAAGNLALEGRCEEALVKYYEYKSKRKELTREEYIELADISNCAKKYSKAIEIYSKLLDEKYDYNIALSRANTYFMNKDSLQALQELEKLQNENLEDDNASLSLADAYLAAHQPGKAEPIYRRLFAKVEDEEEKNNFYKKFLSLGDMYVVVKNFDKADSIFNDVLSIKQSDSSFVKDVNGRKLYLAYHLVQDNKLSEAEDYFSALREKITDPDQKKELNQYLLYLGDAYVSNERYGDASDLYDDLLENASDSTEIKSINQRIGWLPPSGFSKGFSSVGSAFLLLFPTNVSVSPFSNIYMDNEKFRFWNYGARLDAGFIGFLSLGATWSQITLDNTLVTKTFTQLKGLASIYLSKNISISGGYGTLTANGEKEFFIWDLGAKYEIPNRLVLSFSFEKSDARMIIYSPNMFNQKFDADAYRFNGEYNLDNIAKLNCNYSFIQLGDGNKGNDLLLRFGKNLILNGFVGYEYYFADYAFLATFYYSPQNYNSHSIWGEWKWNYSKEFKFKFGGKLGYVPEADFIVSEIFGEANYNPFASLILTARVGYNNSFRYESGYRNLNVSLFAYWGVF